MNNVISRLQSLDPGVINEFLGRLSLSRKRANMPGLLLNGKQMDKIIREDNLVLLSECMEKSEILSRYMVAVPYLRSLRNLHSLMVAKSLNVEYPRIIQEFRDLFDQCFNIGFLSETPKVHLLYSHLEDHFRDTGETLWYADTSGEISCIHTDKIYLTILIFLQGTESIHAGLRRSDETHGCHMSHNLGSNIHLQKSLNSVVFFNSKNSYRTTDGSTNTRDVPTTDDNPDHSEALNDISIIDPINVAASQSLPAPGIPEVVRDSNPVLVAPAPQEKSLSDHLHENGFQIRTEIVTTESGNCWYNSPPELHKTFS